MKPFDLEAAKGGARVCRRDGKIVNFVGTDESGDPVFHDGRYFSANKNGSAKLGAMPMPSVYLAPDPVPDEGMPS